MKRIAEIVLLMGIGWLVFFPYLGRHQYIKTEPLRTVVVDEMLEREGLTMPTVHHAPYLKKPPLYAWITTALARAAGGFTPTIARLPSAVCAILYILLLYGVAERWLGRGVGLPSAVFALLSPTVLDYGVRAELDLPFSFFCTVNLVLTLSAMRSKGAKGVALWTGSYASVLAACMWKGPHALVFMCLTIIAYSLLTRTWTALRSTVQWCGLVATIGVLAWWTQALSAFAGAAHVGQTAGIELFSRLVPYKFGHWLSMLYFPMLLAAITLPASAFVLLTLRVDVGGALGLMSSSPGERQGMRDRLAVWFAGMRAHPEFAALLAWLLPVLLFMVWAPAKAPRYSIPLFAPVFLMAGWTALMLDALPSGSTLHRHGRRVWRAVLVLFAAVGVASVVRMIAAPLGVDFGLGPVQRWGPWIVAATGGTLPAVVEFSQRRGRPLRTRLVLVLVGLLSIQPLIHQVWWPRRVAHDVEFDAYARIAELVSAEDTLFVLGGHHYAEAQHFSARRFVAVAGPDEALAAAGGTRALALVRRSVMDRVLVGAQSSRLVIDEFVLNEEPMVLLEITPQVDGN